VRGKNDHRHANSVKGPRIGVGGQVVEGRLPKVEEKRKDTPKSDPPGGKNKRGGGRRKWTGFRKKREKFRRTKTNPAKEYCEIHDGPLKR